MTKLPRIPLAEVARQTGTMLRRGDSKHFVEGLAPTMGELTESLLFSPGNGSIWLNEQRTRLHSSAVGHLRRELIDTLSLERARGMLKAAVYVSGAGYAQRERWRQNDAANVFMAGTRLHALGRMVKVTPVAFDFDINRGTYQGELLWEHSSENDEHMCAYGVGVEAACWAQSGYVFREVECRLMGASVFRVVGRNAAA